MRIAMIAPIFLPVPAVEGGAVEYLCTELLEGNEKSDRDVIFDVYTKPSPLLNRISYKKANIFQIKTSFFLKVYCKLFNTISRLLGKNVEKIPHHEALIKKYLKGEYDLILIENRFPLFKEIYERTEYQDRLCIHIHNDSDNMRNSPELLRFVMSRAKHVIAVSDYIKKHYHLIAPNEKTSVLLNCVDCNLFVPYAHEKRMQCRSNYHIKEDDIVILYSGRICDYKGIRELIQAFGRLAKNSSLKLMIVGGMSNEKKNQTAFEQEIAQLSSPFSDRIVFTGYVSYSNMPDVYNAADILVIPSLCNEAFCMVAAEGMATERPIIATKSGAMVELLQTEGAILLDQNEALVDHLEEALKSLMENSSLRADMGIAGRKHLLENLKIENTKYFEKFYEIIQNSNNGK